MKRTFLYIIIGVAATALTSACSHDDDGTATERRPVAVTLDVRTVAALETRAGATLVETNGFGEGSTLGLYGHGLMGTADATQGHGTADSVLTATDLQNYPLTLSGEGQRSSLDGYFWPETGEVGFVGYYPQGATGVQGVGRIGAGANDVELPKVSFTMQAQAADQVDLLVSDYTSLTLSASVGGVVPLVFRHALAQLRFYVLMDVVHDGTWWDGAAGQPVPLTVDVALDGLVGSGTLAMQRRYDANASAWTPDGGATATSTASGIRWFEQDLSAPGFDINTFAFNAANYDYPDAAKMMVIPQGGTHTMTVTITDGRTGSGTNAPVVLTADIDLSGQPWRGGYVYSYYFGVLLGKTSEGYLMKPEHAAEQW